MVAYNFPHKMARGLIFGQIASTLQGPGKKAHAHPGGAFTAFVGLVPPDWRRSPYCHRLIDAPCTRSVPVIIDTQGAILDGQRVANPEWYRVIAKDCGYVDFASLQGGYQRTFKLPWKGQYIRWNPSEATFRAQWPLIVKPPEPAPIDT